MTEQPTWDAPDWDETWQPAGTDPGTDWGGIPTTTVDPVTRFAVRDRSGLVQAVHCRRDDADGKTVWWEQPDGTRGLGGMALADLPLYGIDRVDGSASAVVVVEGEKCADRLWAGSIPAVGTVTGAAGTPGPQALAELNVRRVIVWPDHDAVGMGHTDRIAAALVGIAGEVRRVTPPSDRPEGWDAADCLAEPGGQALAMELLANAAVVDPPASAVPAGRILPPPAAPMAVARELVEDQFTDGDTKTIRAWRGGFVGWDGRCWPEQEVDAIRSGVYLYLEDAQYWAQTPLGRELRPWNPTKAKTGNVIDALEAITHLPAGVQQPAWLDGDGPDPRELLVAANGILHVPTRQLMPHDPRLFVGSCVPFAFQPDAPPPRRFLSFLGELWDQDTESIRLLQEVFGYALSGDTSLQKLLLLVGPPRAGKGVIANLLTLLIGRPYVGAPTLAGLTTNFGLQDLIGKKLAVVSDARLGPRADVAALAERLLSISGEDSITIDRKYLKHWTGRLGTRFLLLTNELPAFRDASGALAKRFVELVLTKTFYGKEDPALLSKLLPELPGILNWSLEGLDRLRERQHFTQPASAAEAIRDLEDLASPMSAFLRDRCLVGRDQRVLVDDLWVTWKVWAEDQSESHGTKATLGRNLRAAVPGLRIARLRDGDARSRAYLGVGLRIAHDSHNDAQDPGPPGPGGPEADDPGPAGPRGPGSEPVSSHDDGEASPRHGPRICPACQQRHPAGTTCTDGWSPGVVKDQARSANGQGDGA